MTGLDELFARIPALAGLSPADFTVSRLSGYTNDSYRLRRADADWVLRVPRAPANALIDRDAEFRNQRIAVELGLAPAPAWSAADGTTLTPTLSAARYLSPADLADATLRGRIVQALQTLHRSGRRFRGRHDLAILLERFVARVPPAQRARFDARLEQSKRVLGRLATTDAEPVPSHNDLVLENLLLDGERIWLIDWEYSSQASPYWDLATLANAADLDLAQSRGLLREYGAGAPPLEESILFDYRGLLRLLGDAWMAAFASGGGDADA